MMDENRSEKKKIFIPAIGSLGDVKPYLILAKELKQRGYLVWLGVHQRFEEQIKAQGKDVLLRQISRSIPFLFRY